MVNDMMDHHDETRRLAALDRAERAIAKADAALSRPRPAGEPWQPETSRGVSSFRTREDARPPAAPGPAAGGGSWRRYAEGLEAAIGALILEEREQAALARRCLEWETRRLAERIEALERALATQEDNQ